MEKYFNTLAKTPLFNDINPSDFGGLLKCMGAFEKQYLAYTTIINQEDIISSIGIIAIGKVQIIREDFYGNRTLFGELSEGDVFAESLACSGSAKSPVTILSVTDCTILWFDYNRIVNICTSACSFHTTLIKNMIMLIAHKNVILNKQIDIISKRSIREKILTYLEYEMSKAGFRKFKISFNRSELADYLSTDRSALSRELCKMRDEGIIDFNKNEFELKQKSG